MFVCEFKKMFGTMHFIYYINISIATKVDSAYLGCYSTTHNVYVLATDGREPVKLVRYLPDIAALG